MRAEILTNLIIAGIRRVHPVQFFPFSSSFWSNLVKITGWHSHPYPQPPNPAIWEILDQALKFLYQLKFHLQAFSPARISSSQFVDFPLTELPPPLTHMCNQTSQPSHDQFVSYPKLCQGYFCLSKIGTCAVISSQISSKFTREVVYYLLCMPSLTFLVSILSIV